MGPARIILLQLGDELHASGCIDATVVCTSDGVRVRIDENALGSWGRLQLGSGAVWGTHLENVIPKPFVRKALDTATGGSVVTILISRTCPGPTHLSTQYVTFRNRATRPAKKEIFFKRDSAIWGTDENVKQRNVNIGFTLEFP